MNALLKLAERCEKATGPDRKLDACVAATLRVGTDYGWADSYPAWLGRADGRVYLEDGGPSFAAPVYTASLDAALTLVPEGWSWSLFHTAGAVLRASAAMRDNDGGHSFTSAAHTAALTLCAAALRARAASADTHPTGGDAVAAPFMSGAVPPVEAGDAQNPPKG